jgi:hypothetical protein
MDYPSIYAVNIPELIVSFDYLHHWSYSYAVLLDFMMKIEVKALPYF